MGDTKIEWCDKTWNPVVGCSHTESPGCQNCYAEKLARRLGWGGLRKEGPTRDAYRAVIDKTTGKWNGKCDLNEPAIYALLHWRKPKRIFISSMGDFLHPRVAYHWITRILAEIRCCPQHTFILLTKRPENLSVLTRWPREFGFAEEYPNLWIGVSCSNQADADRWIPPLLDFPAAKHIVSFEPLLGEIDATPYLDRLDWVIIGGETGMGARRMWESWVAKIMVDCRKARVPVFFKHWGTWYHPKNWSPPPVFLPSPSVFLPSPSTYMPREFPKDSA